MKRLIWMKTEDGYNLHKRSNVSWGTMHLSSDHLLTVTFRNKVITKTFSSHKVAVNVSQTVAERFDIKNRFKEDDGEYNLPGKNWNIE
jgi:hypothetical protein